MNQQYAAALAARIEREPEWHAKTRLDQRTHEWVVEAWAPNFSRTPEVFTSPFGWYYLQAKMESTLRGLKATMRKVKASEYGGDISVDTTLRQLKAIRLRARL